MKRKISVCIFVLILLLNLKIISDVLVLPATGMEFKKLASFVENEFKDEDVNILFLGGSKMLNAIQPLTIYQETGLTSINLASNTQTSLVTYNVFLNYLEKVTPEMIVLDFNSMNYNLNLESEEIAYTSYKKGLELLDFNYQINVYKGIMNDFPNYNMMEMYSNIYKMHSIWKDINSVDFMPIKYDVCNFGNQALEQNMSMYIVDRENYEPSYNDNFDKVSMGYFDLLLAEATARNIKIVMISTPTMNIERYSESLDIQRTYAALNNIQIYDYNIDTNFERLEFYDGDFGNENHLSFSGAYKLSKIFAEDLISTTNFENKSSEKVFELYESCSNE